MKNKRKNAHKYEKRREGATPLCSSKGASHLKRNCFILKKEVILLIYFTVHFIMKNSHKSYF